MFLCRGDIPVPWPYEPFFSLHALHQCQHLPEQGHAIQPDKILMKLKESRNSCVFTAN